MLAINLPPSAPACRSCGSSSGSGHQFSCQPGRVVKQGPFRGAASGARTSAAVRANARIQGALARGF